MRKQEIQSQAGGHSLPASFSQSRRSSPRQGATAFQQVFLKVKNPKVWAGGWLPPSPLHAASWLGIWIPCKRPQTSQGQGSLGLGWLPPSRLKSKGWDGRLLSLMLQLDLVGLVSLLKVKNPKVWAWGWLPPSPLVPKGFSERVPARASQTGGAFQAESLRRPSRQTLPGRGLPGRSFLEGLPGRGLPDRAGGPWQGFFSQAPKTGASQAGASSQGLAGGGAFQAGPPRQGPPGRASQAGASQTNPPRQGFPRQGPGRSLPGTSQAGASQAGASQAGASQAGRGLPARGCDVLFEGLGYLILGRPDGFLASDLPGPPRSPQLPAGLELRRPPEGFWLRSYLACRPRAHSV